mmetsp:Transcript_21988/g.51128  ORF Transcript_21988/g.51128 Transcript_21988/m.51128 type:complete len:203 (-) Transcript_21988:671-1279(-)
MAQRLPHLLLADAGRAEGARRGREHRRSGRQGQGRQARQARAWQGIEEPTRHPRGAPSGRVDQPAPAAPQRRRGGRYGRRRPRDERRRAKGGRGDGGLCRAPEARHSAHWPFGPGVRRGLRHGAPVRHRPRRDNRQSVRRDDGQPLPRARHRWRPQAVRAAAVVHPRARREPLGARQHQGGLHGDRHRLRLDRLRRDGPAQR